jgi:hypothetical protein
MTRGWGRELSCALAVGTAALALTFSHEARSQAPLDPPGNLPYDGAHLSPSDGVLRDPALPRGDCGQCHVTHAETQPQTQNLFAPNNNMLCYSTSGIGGCHINRPDGGAAGYPAQEQDRFPDQHPYHGYFEASAGGVRMPGVNNRTRWPGKLIWENSAYSAHYASPSMPRLDNTGRGSCFNCHDPHNGATPYDQLKRRYGPIAGSGTNAAPAEYALCLDCHGPSGPSGLSPESRRIADFYSRVSSGSSRAGHAITSTRGAVKQGDRLPCYDCHNPHGSAGSDGQHPNGYLISDQRPGWYGLTDIRNDSVQVRRFCTGCHAYPDQPGSGGTVEGIRPKALPDEYPHRSYETKHCYDCHGRDYSSPGGFNVHNPSSGENGGGD